MQDRLSHVRAFINCHIDLLQDPKQLAPLTVTDVVKQLVLQESDTVFDSNTDPQWNASIEDWRVLSARTWWFAML